MLCRLIVGRRATDDNMARRAVIDQSLCDALVHQILRRLRHVWVGIERVCLIDDECERDTGPSQPLAALIQLVAILGILDLGDPFRFVDEGSEQSFAHDVDRIFDEFVTVRDVDHAILELDQMHGQGSEYVALTVATKETE